jgi:protease I
MEEQRMADVDLGGRKVLAVVTNYGVEQDELVVPMERLRASGATVDVAAQEDADVVTLVGDKDPGRTVAPDTTIGVVDPAGYDLLLLPGGALNADHLRLDQDAVGIVRAFTAAHKPVAAICHAPWALVEAGAVRGKRLTSFKSLRSDLRNAGGDWADESVVVDHADGWTLITSRDPDDLDDFVGAIDRTLAAVPA